MKKIHIAAAAVLVVIVIMLGVVYFLWFGIQTVSTDKQVYVVGEHIKIHWSDTRLVMCSCSTPQVQVYQQEEGDWKLIQNSLEGFGGACVGGRVAAVGMPCDLVSCSPLPLPSFESGDVSWNSTIYERNGSVNSCFNPYSNETINYTMPNYELRNATPGAYKIKVGNAETTIEISLPYVT